MEKSISKENIAVFKEETERSKNLTKLMRERNKRNLKPKEEFFQKIEEFQSELEASLSFLKNIELEPKTLFTHSSQYFKSRSGSLYTIMNHRKSSSDSIKGHDFQVYLADIADKCFQSWLKSQNIDEPLKIEVRTANQFPSIFSVFHNDTELIQFDLLKQWYGVRDVPLSAEKLSLKHEQEIKRLNSEIQKQNDLIEEAIDKKNNPLKHYKGIKNFFSWLKVNKKDLANAFEQIAKKEQSILDHLLKEKERSLYYFPINKNHNLKKIELLEKVEPFFIELNYTLNTKRNELY